MKDGAITGITHAEPKPTRNTFLVYTNATFDDFELRISYRRPVQKVAGPAAGGG